jgi:hypothetical protein
MIKEGTKSIKQEKCPLITEIKHWKIFYSWELEPYYGKDFGCVSMIVLLSSCQSWDCPSQIFAVRNCLGYLR